MEETDSTQQELRNASQSSSRAQKEVSTVTGARAETLFVQRFLELLAGYEIGEGDLEDILKDQLYIHSETFGAICERFGFDKYAGVYDIPGFGLKRSLLPLDVMVDILKAFDTSKHVYGEIGSGKGSFRGRRSWA